MEYLFTIEYVSGNTNYIADLLSRQPAGTPELRGHQLADNVDIGSVANGKRLPWPSYLCNIDKGLKPFWRA